MASVLQRVEFLDLHGLALAEKGDDDSQSHGDFCRRDCEDEENENVPIQRAVEPRERDEREGRRDEHQLEAHIDDEGVLALKHTEEANGEKQAAEQDVSVEARVHLMSSKPSNFLLSTITPSMAIR